MLELTLTADGDLLHGARPVTIAEVEAAVAEPEGHAPLRATLPEEPWPEDDEVDQFDAALYEVASPSPPAPNERLLTAARRAKATVLYAHRDAPWVHVLWVRPDYLAVARGGSVRALPIIPDPPSWTIEYVSRGIIYVFVAADDDGTVEYWIERERRHRSLASLKRQLLELREHGTYWGIDADPLLHVQAVVPVLAAFHEAGIPDVRLEPLRRSPWVLAQRRLPVPRRDLHALVPAYRWMRGDGTLPLAAGGLPFPDDGQLGLILEADGTLLYKGKRINLDELDTIARQRADAWDLLHKRENRTGYETVDGRRVTTLRVLLYVDRETPWKPVEWILSVLEERHYAHLHLATTPAADLSVTPAEAERYGVPRLDRIPGIEPLEARVLPVRLAAAATQGDGAAVHVAADGSFPPPPGQGEARIRADPRAWWQDVVAAVDTRLSAGVPCVFDRYRRPSERLRTCIPLPLPRR